MILLDVILLVLLGLIMLWAFGWFLYGCGLIILKVGLFLAPPTPPAPPKKKGNVYFLDRHRDD